jgi:uncharacterized protein YcbK (DUF882 family)
MPEEHTAIVSTMGRRTFLGLGIAAAAGAVLPQRVRAASFPPPVAPTRARPERAPWTPARERELAFFNTHTGERLTTTYCCNGEYQPDALERINFILRDFRVNEIKPIDPKLLDLLHELRAALSVDSPYHVISGYRSPQTNAMLRARGGADSGVASGSMHMVGRAIDIRVPGVELDHLREAARSLKLGGVGFYPSSNFVHVDTGRVRFW